MLKLRKPRPSTNIGATILRRSLLHSRGGCCERCGWSGDVSVLHSHHRRRGEKIGEIPALCTYVTRGVIDIEALLLEFERTETLCPTCHRFHHWQEQGSIPVGSTSVDEVFTKICLRKPDPAVPD